LFSNLVDRAGHCAHQIDLIDFISIRTLPKAIQNAELRQKYLKSNLSARQLADEYGVSKQMIHGRLREAGVHGGQGRGRSKDNYRFPNPPYGHRVRSGRLELHPAEMKVARLIVDLRERKNWSFPAIATELYRRGYCTRQRRSWTKTSTRSTYIIWKEKL
jgi:hypothetical protein